ncbi:MULTISPECIES: DUF6037 family protein [Bacillus]|uniref:Uncharacterized protein n=2 Tax=Bacillus wiedmannii TaxID=1890302 RepID=A0A2B5IMS6_9BACI|nr:MULTISPECIES: DUF6037 family protein [Bacillus]MDF9664067.1 DUF6037 family protein [Bacillus wiedmannii]MDI6508187.1 DUF6037 family protein [Bacillus wiedmannii]MDI6513960.1 DUF6037 family protein [Bacillus wiedmannii]PFZ26144.1 hypothetical protein COL51_16220 [Bacillus wiedmannii]PGC51512.1 hypothetical protein COM22_26940 [Bacillus wiedmannii]
MSKTINLTRLFSLSHSMLKQQLDYQVINGIQYKNDLQICAIFKYDYIDLKKKKYNESSDKEYVLGLFKKGTREYIELPLKHKKTKQFESFELPIELDNNLYNKLKIFLEIDQSKHGNFHPWHFFKALNAAIPTKASQDNLDRRVCSYSYPTSQDNEHEKIYFLSFRDNDKRGEKRSLENYAKTQKLLPHANKIIGNRNISVCFTTMPKDINKEIKEMDNKINDL